MKYLDFYYKCMETGKLPNGCGLCNEVMGELFSLIIPTPDDLNELGYEGLNTFYWGFGEKLYHGISYAFTPLRQNLVLLLAAMNDEL